jgi:myo-inositol catabolism protein IolC
VVSEIGYEGPLRLLAFDHRDVVKKAAGQRAAEGKRLIYEGFLCGESGEGAGLLVDEELGGEIAREALAAGYVVAMPVERSGADEFEFEYGDAFGEHIAAFEPTLAKVLVRYDPDADSSAQVARLLELNRWLHSTGRKLLLEVLAKPEPTGDRIARSIRQLRDAGLDPDVWKVEGLDREGDCRRVVEEAHAGGRDQVPVVVLGAGADAATVERWLRVAARVPGYAGFAVGRTLWWDELRGWLDGDLGWDEAAEQIGGNYRRMLEAYG